MCEALELKGAGPKFSAIYPVFRRNPLILGFPPNFGTGAPLLVADCPLILGPPPNLGGGSRYC
jgi:hypothetical protein